MLAAPGGSFRLVSDPIDVSIASPTRREAREMKAALATDAYHYVFAPGAIAMSADAATELRRLELHFRKRGAISPPVAGSWAACIGAATTAFTTSKVVVPQLVNNCTPRRVRGLRSAEPGRAA